MATVLPRRAGPVPVAGYLIGDRLSLDALLRSDAISGSPEAPQHVLAADLSQGGWRPMQLAEELATQMRIALPSIPHDQQTKLATDGIDAQVVGSWVDVESRGDAALLRAHQASLSLSALLGQIEATLFIIVPDKQDAWRRGDAWTLRFLADAAVNGDFRLVLCSFGNGADALPHGVTCDWHRPADPTSKMDQQARTLLDLSPKPDSHWMGCLPGLVSPLLVQQAQLPPELLWDLHMLPSGYGIVPPELRMAASADANVWQAFAEKTVGFKWLTTYHAVKSRDEAAAGLLIETAWSAAFDGAPDLAEELALTATALPGDPVNAQLAVQTIRLISQEYQAMADGPPPPDRASEDEQRQLNRFRGWGHALVGNGEDALKLLGGVPGPAPVVEEFWLDLYLRNISALALVRCGDLETAMAVELDIADRLGRHDTGSWHLTYLNALNTHRLCKAKGDLDGAYRWLARAEEATIGVALPSDLIHFNVLRARLAASNGQEDLAHRHWFAAALLFCALPVPEAIGWRVATAILGKKLDKAPDPEAIAAALLDRLPTISDLPAPPTFRISEAEGTGQAALCVGAPGWSVLLVVGPTAPSFDGPHHARLRATLCRMAKLPDVTGHDVVIDIRHGCGMAAICEDMIGSALWNGAEQVVWDGASLDLDSLLAGADQKLAYAPGISRIDEDALHFKRYRATWPEPEGTARLTALTDTNIEALSDEEYVLAAEYMKQGIFTLVTRLDTEQNG